MTASAISMIEQQGWRVPQWLAAGVAAALLHAGLIATALVLSNMQPDALESGALEIDLPPMAMVSTSTEADNAENPQDAVSSPPPSEGSETPDQPAQSSEPAPAEPQPQPVQEPAPAPAEPVVPAPQPVEDIPPVDEAPLAPEPEVAMPKPVEPEQPKPEPEAKTAETKKPAKEPAKDTAKDKRRAETAKGAKSTTKASAAASGGGKFNPSAISRPRPAYPAAARASKTEGFVVVRYSVSASGAVTSVSVISSSPPGIFNSATVAAVRGWRFMPSASGGSGSTTIRFKLK